jgi:hypothetical protein
MQDGTGPGFPHPPHKGDDGRTPWFPVEAAPEQAIEKLSEVERKTGTHHHVVIENIH